MSILSKKHLKDLSTLIESAAGFAGPVSIVNGFRQGDPITGILFNIGFDTIIRALNALPGITVLVHADDILILADSPEALQVALDVLLVECSKIKH